ncbi:hypothetical protein DFA_02601 [Cavenderia fasciculata]|uniref:26S proteasome non-ATPase regulatory subunit 5 n=1 Tax=Cavenderia fasciculata TaxID=261658 RepID=F4PZU8_CACFS|nr:uncharacterized protein DFA_02601 [Cavenderia fasciculata]EGG18862.1 hypothetical protein DFA_02601 [Cavenderia fasciculata]|eukprot:XP_004357324.1 hypothetical protein DFA_02601 [Cavenderia fasciculata]
MTTIATAVNEFIPLFNILGQTSEEEKIEDTCREISALFEKYIHVKPPLIVADEMVPFIKGGLQHPYHQVRQLTMRQIHNNIGKHTDQLVGWLNNNDILSVLAPMLSSSRLRIANTALEIFSLLSKLSLRTTENNNNNNIKQLLLNKSLYSTLTEILNENRVDTKMQVDSDSNESEETSTNRLETFRKDEVVLRVLDVAVMLAVSSREALEIYKTPFLEYLLNRVPLETDTLVKINLLEIIAKLGGSSLDALSLVSTLSPTFIGDLVATLDIEGIKQETTDSHSINSVIVLVSRWCLGGNAHVNVVMQSVSNTGVGLESVYFIALEYFVAMFRENDVAKRCLETSIGAIGDIGSLENGLDRIIARRSLIKEYMETISAADPIAMCTMHSFATMLIHHGDKHNNNNNNNISTPVIPISTEVSDKLKQVYDSLGGGEASALVLRRLMKCLSSPIEDIKTAALHLAQGLCFHGWGAVALLTTASGFMEYLVSRSNENTKIMREWKFTIVQTLVTRQQSVLDTPTFQNQWTQLQTYYRRGVHYMPADANVEIATHHL